MIEYRLNGPVSQERQRIRLMSALRENRFPQAILIDGPVGIGKKALAIELAKALQCSDPNVRPCGHCFGCKMAADVGVTDSWVVPMEAKEAGARNASDVSAGSTAKTVQDFKQAYIEEIFKNPYRIDIFSAAAGISVELIRTMTNSFVLKGDRVRVVIVAEADRMNESAANAFLKTLEEVPPDTYFILTTSSREKMLQTIRSRCLALHLLPLSEPTMWWAWLWDPPVKRSITWNMARRGANWRQSTSSTPSTTSTTRRSRSWARRALRKLPMQCAF